MARKETKEKETTGGELTDTPNEKYRKFFERFEEIETVSADEYKPVHLIGFFAKRYQETFGTPYKFKFNSPSPAKCFEVFQIKKLAYLLTNQPKLLKDYIEWIYQEKAIKSKRRFTSISFLTNEDNIREFKFGVLLAGKRNLEVNRATLLPSNYRSVLTDAGLEFIKTYGDLAFATYMEPPPATLSSALSALEGLGFEIDLLKRIT